MTSLVNGLPLHTEIPPLKIDDAGAVRKGAPNPLPHLIWRVTGWQDWSDSGLVPTVNTISFSRGPRLTRMKHGIRVSGNNVHQLLGRSCQS